MRWFVALVGAGVLLTATPARAGDSDPGTWWLSPALQSQMHLTARQVCRLDVIYRQSLPERHRRGRQLTVLRERLARILAEGTADEDRARHVIERVYAIERERNVARTVMLFRMYRVLTAGQRRTLAELGVAPPATSSLSISRQ